MLQDDGMINLNNQNQSGKVDLGLDLSSEATKDELQRKMAAISLGEKEEQIKSRAVRSGLGYVNLKGVSIPVEYLSLIEESEAREHKCICFYLMEHKEIRLACVDPEDPWLGELADKFNRQYGVVVKIYLVSDESLEVSMQQYAKVPKVRQVEDRVEVTQDDLNKFTASVAKIQDLQNQIENTSLTELVTLLISTGLTTGSSDIHIEAEEDGIKARYRIDGILHTAATISKDKWKQLISRIKLLSKLKINIDKEPQDGRFDIDLENEKVSVRVSTLPTAYGESVVMRLLRSKSVGLSFDDLGLRGENYELLGKEIQKPNGMIVVTGPTGSGKTTTLYAILNKLNSEETKIVTIEDPIEYELKGINQSQVNPSRGYTFAKGLRTLVRQDPDIIMVGEMRDLETVDIALNAALTGHLVLSTLHTNDAAGAIPRFLAMGAKPYLLAPSLNVIIAQRLVRRLCDCKQAVEVTGYDLEQMQKQFEALPESLKVKYDIKQMQFYGPGKCDKCNGLGYKGRIGIFEIFPVDADVEKLILSGQMSEYEVKDLMKQKGILSMAQDGILRAAEGMTSIEEVFRVAV